MLDEERERPHAGERIDPELVDAKIAEIDAKLSAQLDEVLHHPALQRLESIWRGLGLLIDRTDFRENIRIELVNVSKDDLAMDFESAEALRPGLYKMVYSAEYGAYGGSPYGAIVADYVFTPRAHDVKLLQSCAAVASIAHAPFIAAAGPGFFGADDFGALSEMTDLESHFEGPQYAHWRSFRETDDARNAGLALPRFLGRLPYSNASTPVTAFNYEESVRSNREHYLWVNSAFALATRLVDSFAKWGLASNILGPRSGGAVENLPLYLFDELGATIESPTEFTITDQREYELAVAGFVPLTYREGANSACFFSAWSCQLPKNFGRSAEAKENNRNYKLCGELSYNFLVSRFAHYLKVLHRENLEIWQTKETIRTGLTAWLNQYVNDTATPPPETVFRKPFWRVAIEIEDMEGDPDCYEFGLRVVPHMRYMGEPFELALIGKLEAAKA